MLRLQLIGFFLTFVAFTGLELLLLVLLDRTQRIRRARLVRYSIDHPDNAADVVRRRLQASQSTAASGLRHERRGIAGALERRLIGAGLSLSVRAVVTMTAFLSLLAVGGISGTTALPLPVGLVLGPVVGWVLLNIFLDLRRARRVRAFNEALPECLDIFSRGLRSGQTIAASVGVVAHHTSGIAREEFQQCREELRLGMPLQSALSGMASRIGTPEAHFIVIATNLQAETGGNLVETLDNLATLLRDRHKLRKKAAALSAETRISAVILSGLPFVVTATLLAVNPTYLLPLVDDPRGQILSLAGLASLSAGIFSMYRLSKIDV